MSFWLSAIRKCPVSGVKLQVRERFVAIVYFKRPEGRPTEGGLHGICIRDIVLTEHHHSSSALLALLYIKLAVLETEFVTRLK